jgi:hypothetical protein
MPSVRREGEKKQVVWSWGSHVDQMIREAQERGDFENLPGMGKPLRLDENVFAGEMDSAYRVAKNAGAAPLWVELDREIGEDTAALAAMLDRTARYLEQHAAQLRDAAAAPTPPSTHAPSRRRWWPFGRSGARANSAAPAQPPRSLASLEGERLRARTLYLSRAAELDKKIQEYNSQRPRNLTWLEKPRLIPAVAARTFDERIPALTTRAA